MTKRRAVFFGLGAAVIGCTALLAAFLLPSTPDLMARSTKIADLRGVDGLVWPVHWLDRNRLVSVQGTVQGMSLMSIDVSTKAVTSLTAVNTPLLCAGSTSG